MIDFKKMEALKKIAEIAGTEGDNSRVSESKQFVSVCPKC